ncbi:membrane protein [Nocardioides luteus]|uniref:Membrane protein n=2 Tax=Nocardioides luteus TaxID=1844 RepID=A0ABQ5SRG3_9ACTN|nr:membrane protein [Nocardioides luteus]GLJ66715.1 membrane protein [Nocardioides luteus]
MHISAPVRGYVVAVATPTNAPHRKTMPSKASGLLYGLGFGGFVDGIVLHQILQWHHMVSHVEGYPADTVAGLEVNTLADGFFHVATWLLVLAGSITAIKAWREGRLAPSWAFHFGLVLAGWGIFNVVEGVVNHHLLGVHHVRDDVGSPMSWDIAFLVFGVLLIAGGWLLHAHGVRAMERRTTADTRPEGDDATSEP